MKLVIGAALLAFVATVACGCIYVIRRIRKEAVESEAFLAQLTVAHPDHSAREEYERERERVFTACREGDGVGRGWESERLEEDQGGDPSNAWQRDLPEALRTQLRTALMKRAITNFPVLANLPTEIQQKAQMYQRGLIGQPQWRSVLSMRDWLEEETVQLRHEAECLVEKWGVDGGIFQDAAMFHKHLAKKRMEAAQEQLRKRMVPPQAVPA